MTATCRHCGQTFKGVEAAHHWAVHIVQRHNGLK